MGLPMKKERKRPQSLGGHCSGRFQVVCYCILETMLGDRWHFAQELGCVEEHLRGQI